MTGDEANTYRWADQNPGISHVAVLPNRPLARLLGRAMDIGRRLRSLREKQSRADEPDE